MKSDAGEGSRVGADVSGPRGGEGVVLQWQPYVLIPLAGAVVCAVVGWSAWRRRRSTPAATALAFTMLGLVWWAMAEAIGNSFTSLRTQTTFGLAIYPGVAMVVLSGYWLSRVIVDRDATPRPAITALLFVEPIAMTVASATNGWHHLVFASTRLVGDPGLMIPQVGLIFWLHSAYSYALLSWGFFGIFTARRTATGLYRRQLNIVLLGAVFPAAANVLTLVLFANGGSVDVAVTGFVANGVIYWWALFRLRMLQLVPVARSFVFEQMTDALVVIDRDNRVLDLNPAAVRLARRLQPTLPEDLIGQPAHRLVPPENRTGDRLADGGYVIDLGDGPTDLDARSGDLTDRRGMSIGRVVVVRDTTELNDKKRELTAANGRLQEQLRTIERLQADLAQQAACDDLTGLYNRRYLMRALEAELARAERDGTPLSVVVLDIDRFKSVNDTFGHQVGDELLVAIARVLSSSVRPSDTVARYGGEEFVVLLPGAPAEQARNRALNWRRRCAATHVPTEQGPLTATFSAGVACFPESGTSSRVLLHAADKALYRTKAEGRDRVLLAEVLTAQGADGREAD
jgi:diguanylate cyclase (GGDEF)-like protein